jgi:hypothetical protein
VSRGRIQKFWKINPISLFLTKASSNSSIFKIFLPDSMYSPDVGVSRQPIIFISVDFPDPEGPSIDKKSPFSILRFTFFRTFNSPVPI